MRHRRHLSHQRTQWRVVVLGGRWKEQEEEQEEEEEEQEEEEEGKHDARRQGQRVG